MSGNEFGWRARKTRDTQADMHRRLSQVPEHVYMIECCGLLKIGHSLNPEARLRWLAKVTPISPAPMTLLKTRQLVGGTGRHVEGWIHRKLEKWALDGEWFDCGRSHAYEAIRMSREYEVYCFHCIGQDWPIEPKAPRDWWKWKRYYIAS